MLRKIELFCSKYLDQLYLIHILMFLFFLAILIVPLFLPESLEDATIFNDFTEFSNFVMWGLWFPLVFLSVIFTGRSWCGVFCPMGAASEWANKKGLQRAIPAWVRWEGTPILSFLIITIWGQTVGVRDHREALAILFGSVLIFAIIIGFLYGKNKRAWCRHVCPIGLLLGVFSRIGALTFVPKIKKKSKTRYTEKGLCPTMIKISSKDESRHCIECFRCVNPESKGGLKLQLRKPGEEVENIRLYNPNFYEMWFLFLTVGSVLGGFLWLAHPSYQVFRKTIGEWFLNQDIYWIFESGPMWLMSVYPQRREVFYWLDFFSISSYMLLIMVLFAAIMWFATYISTNLLIKDKFERKNLFIRLSYQYMPIAMVSIIVGLGGDLFSLLEYLSFSLLAIKISKSIFIFSALLWSIYLGYKILNNEKHIENKNILYLLPCFTASSFIAYAWFISV